MIASSLAILGGFALAGKYTYKRFFVKETKESTENK
jgi:hypothetical protein